MDTICISERDPALLSFGQPEEKKKHEKLEPADSTLPKFEGGDNDRKWCIDRFLSIHVETVDDACKLRRREGMGPTMMLSLWTRKGALSTLTLGPVTSVKQGQGEALFERKRSRKGCGKKEVEKIAEAEK